MKPRLLQFAIAVFIAGVISSSAATLYVDLNSANPTPPYSDWSTAATNIQDAINAASDGDQIWVTNGIYQTGGLAMAGTLTNRVALNKAVTVQSVNGPFATTIRGAGATNGATAVRCAWLTNNASLIGFTLTAGATQTSGDLYALESGGGVWCASSNAILNNCVIVSNINYGYGYGSGAYQGTLNNCFVSRNGPANYGGAVYGAILNNCTVVSNATYGTYGGHITNSIVYYNSFGNYNGGSFSYSCVMGGPAGSGNFTTAPQLSSDGIHLASTSPCIGAGTTPITSADIFGNSWANPPSIGCVEGATKPIVGQPQIQVTGAPVGFTVGNKTIWGVAPFTFQWLKDALPLQDNGHFNSTQSSNLVAIGATLDDAGAYQLVVSNTLGATTSAVAQLVIRCVDAAGADPIVPYTNWMNAATQIQDAIDVSSDGEIVLVTNGIYNTGGRVMSGDLTNRIALNKALAVVSVGGYSVTAIEGQRDSESTNGPGAIRCAWLTNGAVLSGFTLRNGATRGGNFITLDLQYGGGAWLSTNAVVSNCAFTNNSAAYGGGGVAFGTVNNSFLTQNTAQYYGGGAYQAVLNNCTILENYCFWSPAGAGVDSCSARNCIVLFNNSGSPFPAANYYLGSLAYSCTDPLPSGTGNIDTGLTFLDPTFHLPAVSPIRGAGSSLYASGTDMDDQAWANPPSMGCSELVLSNLVGPLAVAIRPLTYDALVNHIYGLLGTVTGRAENLSWSFGDGTINTNASYSLFHTWTNAGVYTATLTAYNLDNPSGVSTNVLVVVDPLNSPLIEPAELVSNSFQFSFSAQTNATYIIQSTTNLTPPVTWQTLRTIYFSTGGLTAITDRFATNTAEFYRVQVQ